MRNLLIKASLLVLVVGLMLPAFSFAADSAADVFKAKCAMCHGANAEGKPAMKVGPLKDAAAKSEADLTATITNGKPPKMPAYKEKLSDAQIKDLVTWIKSLK